MSLIRHASPLPAPLSKAVHAGDFLFLSGQTPKNPDLSPLRGDIATQTENVIEAIKATLQSFGLDLRAVVRCTVWLSDLRLMASFNEVYRRHFNEALPVRSTVEARLANNVDIEIEVTAWCPRAQQQAVDLLP